MHPLIETDSTIYSLDDGVLVSQLKAIEALTKQHAIENHAARTSLELAFPVPLLLDVRKMKDVTAQGILESSKFPDASQYTRVAFVVSSALHEIMVLEGKKLEQKAIAVKVFHEYESAMRWLQQKST